MDTDELQKLVEKGLKKSGLSARQASIRAVGHDGLIRDIRKGRNPSFSNACKLLEVLNIGLDINFLGKLSIDKKAPSAGEKSKVIQPFFSQKNLNERRFNSDFFEIVAALGLPNNADFEQVLSKITQIKKRNSWQKEVAALCENAEKLLRNYDKMYFLSDKSGVINEQKKDYSANHPAWRLVPIMEYEAAAGGGRTNLDEAPQRTAVAFRRDWLDEHVIDPNQSAIIQVAGESMEPTLPAGSQILIDRTHKKKKRGYIYVILTDNGLIVKRLELSGNTWYLKSDNPAWEQIAWPTDAKIIGRVMWAAKSFL